MKKILNRFADFSIMSLPFAVQPFVMATCILFCNGSCGFKENADLLLINGNIHTIESVFSKAEALAIRNGFIIAVGTNEHIRRHYIGMKTLDLKGATVVPGLTDAHIHLLSLGRFLQRLNLKQTRSFQDLLDSVYHRTRYTPKQQWILGRGWDQNQWPDFRFPEHRPLSALTPEHFVVLTRVDGHAVLVNNNVLRLARIDASTPDPPGGRIIRYPDGSPTGLLIDNAKDLIAPFIPKPSKDDDLQSLRMAFAHCIENGITSIHEAGVTKNLLELFHDLGKKRQLPIRIYAMLGYSDTVLLEQYLSSGPLTGLYGNFLSIRAIKLFADGTLGSRSAALLHPYSDEPSTSGLILTPADNLHRLAQKAAEKGFQLCTHAIGDSANRMTLEIYHQTLKRNGLDPASVRWRIEHAQILHPDDIPLFGKYGIIASMQPRHCTSDMAWAESRLGKHRLEGAYAWRSLLQNKALLCFGSDAPVEPVSPFEGLHAAVTRQDPSGYPEKGWFPEQCLTPNEALRAYTLDAAYAAFEENRKGSIEKGKYADLIVLSDDITQIPPKKILNTYVQMTIVNGKIVYQRNLAGH